MAWKYRSRPSAARSLWLRFRACWCRPRASPRPIVASRARPRRRGRAGSRLRYWRHNAQETPPASPRCRPRQLSGARPPRSWLWRPSRPQSGRPRRYRRVAAPDQHCVQGIGQVRRGVDQRAVEVENDGRISQIVLAAPSLPILASALTRGGSLGISHHSSPEIRAKFSCEGGSHLNFNSRDTVFAHERGRGGELDDLKERAALSCARLRRGRHGLGPGTGSTAAKFVDALGRASPTASRSSACRPPKPRARRPNGSASPFHPRRDAAAAFDRGWRRRDRWPVRLIKGGGGALLREKIVATASDQMVVIADDSKLVGRSGDSRCLSNGALRSCRDAPMVEAMAAQAGCEGEISLRRGEQRRAVPHRSRQSHPRLCLRPHPTSLRCSLSL